jgi:hypothetical protein
MPNTYQNKKDYLTTIDKLDLPYIHTLLSIKTRVTSTQEIRVTRTQETSYKMIN